MLIKISYVLLDQGKIMNQSGAPDIILTPISQCTFCLHQLQIYIFWQSEVVSVVMNE